MVKCIRKKRREKANVQAKTFCLWLPRMPQPVHQAACFLYTGAMTYFFETYGCEMNIAESAAAEQLFIAESTVKSNLKVIFNKLGINSRNELKNFF